MTPIAFKEAEKSQPHVFASEKVAHKKQTPSNREYCCASCHTPIAPATMTPVGGKRRHTFANPGGEVYYIGCFPSASHLLFVGAPSDQFTWFPGYSWQVVVCAHCGLHLGWHFMGPTRFYGLILARLILIGSGEE